MSAFNFSKLIPGGNPTLLLPDPEFAPGGLPDISARLMGAMHIQAEQVGALYGPGRAPACLPGVRAQLPHLQMMGGEFCVNATRGAALLLARQGLLKPVPGLCRIWGGRLTVSGQGQAVRVLAASDPDALETAIAGSAENRPELPAEPMPGSAEKRLSFPAATRPGPGIAERQTPPSRCDNASPADATRLHCAARMDCADPGVRCLALEPGVTLVRLPGIFHLLVDLSRHSLPEAQPDAWKAAAADWRAVHDLAGSPASGVVWYERLDKEYRIWPVVKVEATGSEHLESACGSASLALALACDQDRDGKNGRGNAPSGGVVRIIQPSGDTLRVILAFSPSGAPRSAWIAGLVCLVAQGTAFL